MHESFYPLFQLNESTVIGNADDLAGHPGLLGIFLGNICPRIRCRLFEAKRYPLVFLVEFKDHDSNAVANGKEFGGMTDAAPRHVGDVEQSVNAAEIDKGAVLGDVLDHAFNGLTLGQRGQRFLLGLLPLLFKQDAARQDDVAAAFVQLDDAHMQLFTNELVEIANGPQVDLRSGKKRLQANVNRQAALDARENHALDDLVPVIALADLVPDFDAVRLFLGEDDLAFAVFLLFKKNIHFLANLKLPSMVGEFVQINRPFGLVADIYQHGVPSDVHHTPTDNLAFLDVLETFFIELFQFLVAADVLLNNGRFTVAADVLLNNGRFTGFWHRRRLLSALLRRLWCSLLYGLNLPRFVSHGNSSLLINYGLQR